LAPGYANRIELPLRVFSPPAWRLQEPSHPLKAVRRSLAFGSGYRGSPVNLQRRFGGPDLTFRRGQSRAPLSTSSPTRGTQGHFCLVSLVAVEIQVVFCAPTIVSSVLEIGRTLGPAGRSI